MLQLVQARAAAMKAVFEQHACSLCSAAKMAVFLADLPTTRAALEDYRAQQAEDLFLDVSLSNSHKKTFVSGEPQQLRQVPPPQQFREWARLHRALGSLVTNMTDAYHCRTLSQAKLRFREHIAELPFAEPRLPVYRNCDARLYSKQNIVEGLCDHFDHTVLFHQSVLNAVAADRALGLQTCFLDVGSNGFLSKCVEDIEAELLTTFDKQRIDS